MQIFFFFFFKFYIFVSGVKASGRDVTQNRSRCNRTKGTAEREGGKWQQQGRRTKYRDGQTKDDGCGRMRGEDKMNTETNSLNCIHKKNKIQASEHC